MLSAAVKKQTAKPVFPHHDLTGIADLSADDIAAVLDLADHYVVQNRRRSQTTGMLKGMMAVNLFLENSTRTRLSFEIGAKRLGADVVNMTAESSQVPAGDSFTDTLRAINAMLPDIVIVRHAGDGAARTAAEIIDCAVISGGDGGEHPTQALLDALTLRRRFGRLEGLNVCIVGDIAQNRVARSNILLLEKMGAAVSCTGPREFLPPGANPDMAAALKGADAVMVLRVQKDRAGPDYFKTWGLTAEKLKHARSDAVVMHPGPLNRGVEIDAALADDPDRSLITTQVEMGVAVRMACLDLLTRGRR